MAKAATCGERVVRILFLTLLYLILISFFDRPMGRAPKSVMGTDKTWDPKSGEWM